nr:MAG TPA: hypothetical protein [Caudoviricetes sp.]
MKLEDFKKLSMEEKKDCNMSDILDVITEVQIKNQTACDELYRSESGVYSTVMQIMISSTIILYLFGFLSKNPLLLMALTMIVNLIIIVRHSIRVIRIREAINKYIILQHDLIRSLYKMMGSIPLKNPKLDE